MANSLVLFSSARRDGNTNTLISLVRQKIGLDVIDINQLNIKPFDYGFKNQDDDFSGLLNTMLKYQNIIFASPVYWYSPTPQMKSLIDRFTDFLELASLKPKGKLLRQKNMFVISTSNQATLDKTFESIFSRTFDYLDFSYGGYLHMHSEKKDHTLLSNNIDEFVNRLNPLTSLQYSDSTNIT